MDPLFNASVRGELETPLGRMVAVLNESQGLQRLDFMDDAQHVLAPEVLLALPQSHEAVQPVAHALQAYFEGALREFSLAMAAVGSEYQQRAWQAMRQIPYGQTCSYGELALSLHTGSSARAMGRACALNPIAIVVPCHRVTGAHGQLVGYSAGVARKIALLSFERACLAGVPASRMDWRLRTQLSLDWAL